MSNIKRTMLIVEDEEPWQDTIAMICEAVHEKLYGNKGKIVIAANLDEAIRVLNETPPDFASVDLNLEGTKQVKDPGGLKVLKAIETLKLKTVSIVVSGENNPHFWAISKRYHALTFQQKIKGFEEIFDPAVEAALLYMDARDLLDNNSYKAALEKWAQAKETIFLVQKNEETKDLWSFPLDIEEEYRARFKYHSVTGLPTQELVNDELKRLFTLDEWWLFYIEIKHLNKFIENEGYQKVGPVLLSTQNLLEENFIKNLSGEVFWGHTIDNIFVLTVTNSSLSDKKIKDLVTSAKKAFDNDRPSKYYDNMKNLGETDEEMMTLAVGFAKGEKHSLKVGKLNLGQIEYKEPEYVALDRIDEAMREEALQ